MALPKINLMQKLFGISDGHICRECSNLVKETDHDRVRCKCRVYGMTRSSSFDWAGRWQACGMFNKTWRKEPVMRAAEPERKQEDAHTPLDGQIRLDA